MSGVSSRAAALWLTVALVACVTPVTHPAPAPPPPPSSARPAAAQDDPAAEVGRLVNEHRARIGCAALAWDGAAVAAARAHTDDMVRRGYFSHVSPEGGNVGSRVTAAGATWRSVAENIASGQPTAVGVVRGWLASPGHRANIENCAYTRQGVGYRDRVWTHVFYTPMSR
jgi:uncharacterized protein YkwD